MLQRFLERNGFKVECAHTAQGAREHIGRTEFDLVLSDLRLPQSNGIELLSKIKELYPLTPVILMTGYAEVGTAVKAMKKGAFDYISKPFTPDEMLMVIDNALKSPKETTVTNPKPQAEKKHSSHPPATSFIAGSSEASQKLNEYIGLVAPTNMSVLITGESGTGKEVTARTIHEQSERSSGPFVAVDCGAIPKELASSILFGHIKGSFTGAVQDRTGHFEAANGGTLFLDEIGNLSYANQAQLLRAIQERKIKKIGSSKDIDLDVRILTATNENLLHNVEDGKFREDLYHRINEFSIEIPALRERGEDLLVFADHFFQKANTELRKELHGFSPQVEELLLAYSWPGNLREMQNVIKRAVLLSPGPLVEERSLPKEITQHVPKKPVLFSKKQYEEEQIIQALQKTNFNKSKAAKLLRITRKTLYNKINQYGMDV